MHHDTFVTHVPLCKSRSLARGGGDNVPGIPGACATRNFAYLVRGPYPVPGECHGHCTSHICSSYLFRRQRDGPGDAANPGGGGAPLLLGPVPCGRDRGTRDVPLHPWLHPVDHPDPAVCQLLPGHAARWRPWTARRRALLRPDKQFRLRHSGRGTDRIVLVSVLPPEFPADDGGLRPHGSLQRQPWPEVHHGATCPWGHTERRHQPRLRLYRSFYQLLLHPGSSGRAFWWYGCIRNGRVCLCGWCQYQKPSFVAHGCIAHCAGARCGRGGSDVRLSDHVLWFHPTVVHGSDCLRPLPYPHCHLHPGICDVISQRCRVSMRQFAAALPPPLGDRWPGSNMGSAHVQSGGLLVLHHPGHHVLCVSLYTSIIYQHN